MTWKDFCAKAEEANRKLAAIRDDLSVSANDKSFFRQASLVVCLSHNAQLTVAKSYPYLSVSSSKELMSILINPPDNSKDIDLERLEIKDDIQFELRFPAVNSKMIQAVKAHPAVDNSKTCTCRTCVKVVLL